MRVSNMSIQEINIGQYPNDGLGDDLRTAFQKVNLILALSILKKIKFSSSFMTGFIFVH